MKSQKEGAILFLMIRLTLSANETGMSKKIETLFIMYLLYIIIIFIIYS